MDAVKHTPKLYVSIENEDTGHSALDGPFRSFHLDTYGNDLAELLENALINEIDQDGGEYSTKHYGDYTHAVIRTVEEMISRAYLEALAKFNNERYSA